jgi:hypothetical protein
VKATPYNKESSANSSHLGQLLMLATAVMLPEEAPAQVQWWHQLRPAFEGALRLWQYDEDDIIRVQQVALEQVERLAPHLPPAELISMCKVRMRVAWAGAGMSVRWPGARQLPGLSRLYRLLCAGPLCLPAMVPRA